MKPSVCFVSNFEKTELFERIARVISHEYAVCWIAPGRRWGRWLVDRGHAESSILVVADSWQGRIGSHRDAEAAREAFEGFPLTFEQARQADRIARHAHPLRAYGLVTSLLPQLEEFFAKHNPAAVFGEATWLVELLIAAYASRKAVPYLVPATVRYPNDRFGFFQSPLQDSLFRLATEPDEDPWSVADSFVGRGIGEENRPRYYYDYLDVPLPRWDWVRRAWRKASAWRVERRHDPTLRDITEYLWDESPLRRTANWLSTFTLPFERRPAIDRCKSVVFTMHKQPEASIDVLGVRYRHQAKTATAIADSLPPGYTLLVKEHPNALGDRGRRYYESLRSHPKVRLVHPKVSSLEMLRDCACVITVSGTIAYEAGLMGRPAVTLSPMFFNDLPTVLHLSDLGDDSLKTFRNLPGVLRGLRQPERYELVQFVSDVVRHSNRGFIGDPLNTPSVLAKQNIECLHQGFTRAIRSVVKGNLPRGSES